MTHVKKIFKKSSILAAILDFGQFTLIENILWCHKWILDVKTHSYAENCQDLCLFSSSKTDFAIFLKIANFIKVPLIRCNFDHFCNGKLMETFFLSERAENFL